MPSTRTPTASRRWLTQQEAADYLGVSIRSVRNYIARGHLPAYRVGGTSQQNKIRVDARDVDTLLHPIPTVGGGA